MANSATITGLAFDLDGTLVQFPKRHLFSTARQVFAELGLGAISEEQMQRSFERFDFFSAVPEAQRGDCAELLAVSLERAGHPPLIPFEDTLTVLNELHDQGLTLSIATARVVEPQQLSLELETLKIRGFFKYLACRSRSSRDWKDKGPQLKAICDALELEPRQLAFVGDIPSDVESAKRFGCGLTFALTSGGILPERLQASQPDFLITSLSEIPQLLCGNVCLSDNE